MSVNALVRRSGESNAGLGWWGCGGVNKTADECLAGI